MRPFVMVGESDRVHRPKTERYHLAQEVYEVANQEEGAVNDLTRGLLPWARECALGLEPVHPDRRAGGRAR